MFKFPKHAAVIAMAVAFTAMPLKSQSADLLVTAKQYIGQSERTNRKSLRNLLGVDPAITRWCGAFLSFVARRSGYRLPASHNQAAGWRSFGSAVKLKNARSGDVVVLRGHVTIFTRFAGAKVCGIGGNQSNTVRESCYSQRRVVAVRRPVKR